MKVLFRETKFNVNEEKKTVTCVIVASVELSNRQEKVSYDKYYGPEIAPFQTVGVAKCHEDDVFDLEKGRRLAESRAKAKVYEEGTSRLKKILMYVDIFGEDIQNQLEKLKGYHKKEKEHLIELKSEIKEETEAEEE